MASVRRQTHHPLFHPQIVRLSRSGMNLRPRGRQKGRVAPVAAHSTGPPFAALSSDAIRESLSLIKGSADAFPPLKSTVVGVLAVWDLVERVSASDENAQALARRVVGILDVIYKAVGGGAVPVSPEMLEEMLKFEEYAQLLHEISAAMEQHLKAGRLRRVLHLRRQESRLAQFTARLDAAAEAFKIGSSTRIDSTSTHIELTSTRIESTSSRVELTLKKIQADVVMLAVGLEESNIRLRGEVKFLRQTVVLFGLSPVSRGFSEGGCACAL
ncbi:hypothetical protein B0H17DRAFT_1066105 [Mycena rosella]|uniref:Uncharacterized protein n=1 Tax=Mycena rosella TaxID=1033263 RepID=A0AAD7DHH7_MYCRO|nr:hypothetical protein B0H17DRAFT_1066105 [Mycena rosella]